MFPSSKRRKKMKKTCVSMNCPFITVCHHYNFLEERQTPCEYAERIVELSEIYKNRNPKIKSNF